MIILIYSQCYLIKKIKLKNVPNILKEIRLSKEYYKFNHFKVDCSLESYTSRLKNSIEILSSPINTHSIPSASLVVEAAQKNGNIIIYGGEGADESFLGYETYKLKNNKFSDYNRICNSRNFSKDALERVKNSHIQAHITKFKKKLEHSCLHLKN